MPNGKPGDHPLTDLLHYGISVFDQEITSLVRELSDMPGFEGVRERVANLLWDNCPRFQNHTPDFDKVRKELLAIRAELSR